MRKTMVVAVLLAASAVSQGATLQFEGTAEPFLPGFVTRDKVPELQATRHGTQSVVVYGCEACPDEQGTDLWSTVERGQGWNLPSRASLSRRDNEALPSFSSDGYWLYFTSTQAGGFGGADLMRSHFVPYRNTFAPPELLQGTINSKGDEGGAAANEHGATVIFATRGRKGAKGWDLFVSRRVGGKMSEAERLDMLDTDGDEFDPALLANGAGLVFARAEKGGKPSLWFAPADGDFFKAPVKLGPAVNVPGSAVRGAQQDWSDPAYLLFTRDGDILRIRYRVAQD